MMTLGVEKKLLRPAFLVGVLAIFMSALAVQAQTVKDLPPPPPAWKPKPTPVPTPPKPPEKEVLDVIRTTSNLIMVPVSVTDQTGQAVQGLTKTDFLLREEGKQQEITEIGDPQQVPLAIALLFDISSSVGTKGFFASQQNAAATFLKTVMKPADKAAIFTITGEPTQQYCDVVVLGLNTGDIQHQGQGVGTQGARHGGGHTVSSLVSSRGFQDSYERHAAASHIWAR